ncbi:MAG: TerC family protein [Candidatus Obscuribacter sp.]|jgi:predicted tellurium resistance membrane protein TerC|nr:TerC family protein [Candidatus Obscuribacter sp.]MBK9205885.1 TerC family protein [Candidatus Obscuribacter sp.]MBK9773367.1 TerC family protein [Candidatus Obscuribacter sp.]MBL0187274.1 TerC family protein [Candidatus Obscuribacter sp.]MBP6350192.1 TerC family protein [Candidatus Obscuribacter sp.]
MDLFVIDTEIAAALASLTAMEIVLGIDNIIFISILASRLPEHQRRNARLLGLALAMLTRVALLFSLSWVMSLKTPLFDLFHHPFTGRDLLLLGGGLFLVAKATREIHERIEGDGDEHASKKHATFVGTLIQILILDIVFSLDSVITAVGMVDQLWIMITAVVISVITMMVFATSVSNFIAKHPTVKMLALSFLLLIGVVLIGDGFGHHVAKGYIYGAMAFSVFVEVLNLAASHKGKVKSNH